MRRFPRYAIWHATPSARFAARHPRLLAGAPPVRGQGGEGHSHRAPASAARLRGAPSSSGEGRFRQLHQGNRVFAMRGPRPCGPRRWPRSWPSDLHHNSSYAVYGGICQGEKVHFALLGERPSLTHSVCERYAIWRATPSARFAARHPRLLAGAPPVRGQGGEGHSHRALASAARLRGAPASSGEGRFRQLDRGNRAFAMRGPRPCGPRRWPRSWPSDLHHNSSYAVYGGICRGEKEGALCFAWRAPVPDAFRL